ncbi:hypothetical protein CR513_58748, partial [Mucuna pruriens]
MSGKDYSNTKTYFHEVAIKGFGTCMILRDILCGSCDYKYNDENTVSFVTLNKVGRFLQRMDLACKYAFGKMLLLIVIDECYDIDITKKLFNFN